MIGVDAGTVPRKYVYICRDAAADFVRDTRTGLVAQFRRVVEHLLRATVTWLWVFDSPCPGKEDTTLSRDKSAGSACVDAVKASAAKEAFAVKAVRTTYPLLLDFINVLRELGVA